MSVQPAAEEPDEIVQLDNEIFDLKCMRDHYNGRLENMRAHLKNLRLRKADEPSRIMQEDIARQIQRQEEAIAVIKRLKKKTVRKLNEQVGIRCRQKEMFDDYFNRDPDTSWRQYI